MYRHLQYSLKQSKGSEALSLGQMTCLASDVLGVPISEGVHSVVAWEELCELGSQAAFRASQVKKGSVL